VQIVHGYYKFYRQTFAELVDLVIIFQSRFEAKIYRFVSESNAMVVVRNVLWATDRLPLSRYQQFAEQHFSSDDYDVIMFENLKANKSVKSVHHLHVLVKEKHCTHAQG